MYGHRASHETTQCDGGRERKAQPAGAPGEVRTSHGDAGMSNCAVAEKLRITGATVCKWRERFRVDRLDGLLDEPRVGAPRSISDRQVEEVVTKTLESMPAHSTHWSTRLMARETVYRRTRLCASGMRLGCSRIAWRTSNSPRIRSLSRRCATSSACI